MKITSSLKERLEAKDERSFVELFDICYNELYLLSYRYVLDYDVANDCVQETLIALYEKKHLKQIKDLAAYLRVSVRNRSLNYLRNLSIEDKNRMLYMEELLVRESWDETELDVLFEALEREVESLSISCRTICKMKFYEGLKIHEIARQLNIAEGTVKAQIYRAIKGLNRRFEKDALYEMNVTKVFLFFLYVSFL